MFTLLHGLLLRSLPVTAPQELVRISLNRDAGPGGGWLDYGMLKRIDELDRTFADISAWRNQQVPVEDADGTLRQVEVAFVTGNAFDLLGLRPRLGRQITASDDMDSRAAPRRSSRLWVPVVVVHCIVVSRQECSACATAGPFDGSRRSWAVSSGAPSTRS